VNAEKRVEKEVEKGKVEKRKEVEKVSRKRTPTLLALCSRQ
jgi:hypothetical protein